MAMKRLQEQKKTAGRLSWPFHNRKAKDRPTQRLSDICSCQGEIEICGRISDNKAPGLNGVPYKLLKLAVKSRPGVFCITFEVIRKEGIFPAQ